MVTLPEPTTMALAASALVAAVSAIMAYLGLKSFRNTGNPRLLFIVMAFLVFIIKSVFVGYNVQTHVVQHDAIEFVSALFDVIIVLLLFIPFFLPNTR